MIRGSAYTINARDHAHNEPISQFLEALCNDLLGLKLVAVPAAHDVGCGGVGPQYQAEGPIPKASVKRDATTLLGNTQAMEDEENPQWGHNFHQQMTTSRELTGSPTTPGPLTNPLKRNGGRAKH